MQSDPSLSFRKSLKSALATLEAGEAAGTNGGKKIRRRTRERIKRAYGRSKETFEEEMNAK